MDKSHNILDMNMSQNILDEEDSLAPVRLNSRTVFEYLSKYGFNDGDGVLPEERSFCEQEATRLAAMLRNHLTDWNPCVVMTGHNPYYVSFVNSKTGETVGYYNMDERDRRKIDKVIDVVIKS